LLGVAACGGAEVKAAPDAGADSGATWYADCADRHRAPSGACVANDRCEYTAPGDDDACKVAPTGSYTPAIPGRCDCVGGSWSCTEPRPGSVVMPCPDAQRTVCASGDFCSPNACAPDEICFTSLSCAGDGGACVRPHGGAGDDRCHHRCSSPGDCPLGETCAHPIFWACTPDNALKGEGICCSVASGCR
jgi:hypothetical protein